jgi:hypothetical protein
MSRIRICCTIRGVSTETIRKTVPLSAGEVAELEAARTDGTVEHAALTELAGDARSESAVLHALVALGIRSVQERVLEKGYAALAASQDEEDEAYHAAMRGRRRGSSEG